jgi:hypothetical protein
MYFDYNFDYNISYFGDFMTPKFTDIYPTVNDFLNDYNSSAIPTTISEQSATILYYLLYSRFGNNRIASLDRNRFKYDLFGTTFSYGPAWEKKLDIQKQLRELSDTDLLTGATQIINHAYNPGTAPTTATLDELTGINEQNASKLKKDKLNTYTTLYNVLVDDVTEKFISKYRKLFITVLQPVDMLHYETIEETDNDGN